MSITLIGGMDRLHSDYIAAAKSMGHKLRCIARNERNFQAKIGAPDMLIVFTNKISHEAKRKASEVAKNRGLPIRLIHSCGVSTLCNCLKSNMNS